VIPFGFSFNLRSQCGAVTECDRNNSSSSNGSSSSSNSNMGFLAEPVRIDPGCSYRQLGEMDGFCVLLLCYQRLVGDSRGRFGGDVRVRV
jgi:hypothetical protein